MRKVNGRFAVARNKGMSFTVMDGHRLVCPCRLVMAPWGTRPAGSCYCSDGSLTGVTEKVTIESITFREHTLKIKLKLKPLGIHALCNAD